MRLKKIAEIIGFLSITLTTTVAFAGGIYIGDQGARAQGRGGAFTVRADDPSAIEYNPAGLANLDGFALYLSNRFGYADETYKRATTWDWSASSGQFPSAVSFEQVSNETPWQLLGPMLVLASDFGLDNWGFALGAYAPPGVAKQKFPADGGQRYMLLERDVQILYYDLSVAWKHRDIWGIGVSLQMVDLALLRLRLVVNGEPAPGAFTPVSSLFDMEATVEGSDQLGASAIAGLWYRPRPCLAFAFSARFIPSHFNAESEMSLTPLGLDESAPPELKPDNEVTFSMTLPVELRWGLRYIYLSGNREIFDLELDFRYEYWSNLDKFVINGEGRTADILGTSVEIGVIEIPKRWEDTFSVRLGGDVNLIPERLTLRAGGFFESAAAPRDYAYVDFPASERLGVSLGGSFIWGGFEVGLAYTYVYEWPFAVSEEEGRIYQQMPGGTCKAPYTDPNMCDERYLGQPSPTVNAGTYVSSYHFVSLSLSYVIDIGEH